MENFISWIDGKRILRPEIVKRFPEKIGRYIEVCGEAAWVLFYKERYAETEVYNDVNGNLVNLFRCVKYHAPEVQRQLLFILDSRDLFEVYRSQYQAQGLTDIQRAARFFMLLKISYDSNGRSYGCVKKDVNAMIQQLNGIQERLSKVIIERKDFEDIIKVYDKPDALFYVDPPYYGSDRYYKNKFTQQDHIRLNEELKNVKGKFLLSYNDCDFVRGLYQDFTIEEVSWQDNLRSRYDDKSHIYRELLIKNY